MLYALGNQRPDALSEVEDALWYMIIKIAGSSTAKAELEELQVKYAAMKQRWNASGINLFLDFFQIGM